MTEHRLIPLAEQPSKPIDWLWPDRIPLGGLTVCDGATPAGNKSTMLYDVAARVTTGRPMPFCSRGADTSQRDPLAGRRHAGHDEGQPSRRPAPPWTKCWSRKSPRRERP